MACSQKGFSREGTFGQVGEGRDGLRRRQDVKQSWSGEIALR